MSTSNYEKLKNYRTSNKNTQKVQVSNPSNVTKCKPNRSIHMDSIKLIFDPINKLLLTPLSHKLHKFLDQNKINKKFCEKSLILIFLITFGFVIHKKYNLLPVYVACILFGLVWKVGFSESRNSEKHKSGKKSAYSVFNENCEKIQGEFTAEKFEKQLRQSMF